MKPALREAPAPGWWSGARRWRMGVAVVVFAAGQGVATGVAADEWRVTFRVTETRTETPSPARGEVKTAPAPAQPAEPVTTTSEFDLVAALGDGYLAVTDAGETRLRDFARKRMLVLPQKGDDGTETSLHAFVGFRVMELQNRFFIGGAMRAAGVGEIYAPFDMECIFGLQVPNQGTQADGVMADPFVVESRGDGARVYRHEDRVVTVFLPGGVEVPQAWRPGWERFLAHEVQLHPRIRAQVAAEGHLPERLEFTVRDAHVLRERTFVLVGAAVHVAVPPGERVAGRTLRSRLGPERLLAVLAKAESADAAPTLESATAFAEAAVAAKRPLDALLALVEYGLQTGIQPVAEMTRYREVFQKDRQCQRYFSAGDQSSKAATERSLKAYEAIARRGLEKAYVLDIMRANMLTPLGRTREAEGLLLTALEANPYLAGVLHDLGQIYFRDYEMQQAWTCWDAARRLYPDHDLMQQVTAFEARMERDFPVFY